MSMSRGSFALKKARKDDYTLDFTELREQYVQDSTIKIPFVKSSFIHYSKCPRNMRINGKEYNDLVITMELIQAPAQLTYTQLENPAKAAEMEKARKREEKIAQAKAEKLRKLREAREERRRVREQAREEKRQARQARSGSEDEDDDDDDDDEDSDEDDDEDVDDEDIDVSEDEDEEEESGYGSEERSEEESGERDSDESSGLESGEGTDADREYNEDMFKDVQKQCFAAAKFDVQGMSNTKLGTEDYCCVSLWSTGGKLQRYVRLKDTTLRIPPLSTD